MIGTKLNFYIIFSYGTKQMLLEIVNNKKIELKITINLSYSPDEGLWASWNPLQCSRYKQYKRETEGFPGFLSPIKTEWFIYPIKTSL